MSHNILGDLVKETEQIPWWNLLVYKMEKLNNKKQICVSVCTFRNGEKLVKYIVLYINSNSKRNCLSFEIITYLVRCAVFKGTKQLFNFYCFVYFTTAIWKGTGRRLEMWSLKILCFLKRTICNRWTSNCWCLNNLHFFKHLLRTPVDIILTSMYLSLCF